MSAQECFDGVMSSCDQLYLNAPPGAAEGVWEESEGATPMESQWDVRPHSQTLLWLRLRLQRAMPRNPRAEETALAQTQFDAAMVATPSIRRR